MCASQASGPFCEPDVVDRDRPHLDQRRVERRPGDAVPVVRHVHPAADGEPVLAAPGKLVDFGPHHRPGDVHPHRAAGHVEGVAQVDGLLLAAPAFLSSTLVMSTRSRPSTTRISRRSLRSRGPSDSISSEATSGPASLTATLAGPAWKTLLFVDRLPST